MKPPILSFPPLSHHVIRSAYPTCHSEALEESRRLDASTLPAPPTCHSERSEAESKNLDPPFNSNRNYAAPVGSKAAGAAFKDTWTYSDLDVAALGRLADTHPGVYAVIEAAGLVHGSGMKSYLVMMADRLVQLHRILKPTGSIYLHCDPTAGHYLKLLLDAIFGSRMFKAEVNWQRTFAHSDSRAFGNVSDKILFYGDSRINVDTIRTPLNPSYVKSHYRYRDKRGIYRDVSLTGSGVSQGLSGELWRGCDPNTIGRHWAVPKTGKYADWIESNVIPGYRHIGSPLARLDVLDQAGLLHYTKSGSLPSLKRYLKASPGQVPHNNWTDIPPINSQARERLGYPTQKPLALLERIISASSNEGDVVLDPFCGCATTLIAADKLGRRWAGIDISPKAVELVRLRMAQTNLDIGGRHLSVHTRAPSRSDGAKMPRRQIRHTLYGQQEGNCNGCREHFAFHMLEVDHIWPRSKGGPDPLENSQLLCRHCNSLKATGAMDHLAVKLAAWQRGN